METKAHKKNHSKGQQEIHLVLFYAVVNQLPWRVNKKGIEAKALSMVLPSGF